MNHDNQIIKCRDDKAPITLSKVATDDGAEVAFRLAEDSVCSWLSKEETVPQISCDHELNLGLLHCFNPNTSHFL